MKFKYKPHFKFRAQERDINIKLAKEIYLKAVERYFNTLRNRHIAIAKLKYRGKTRKLMVAYDRIGKTIEFVTTHIIREEEIQNKISAGRWRYEKD